MSQPLGFKVCHSKLSLNLKSTLPLSTACSTEIWDYLSKTEELSPQEKIDRWIFGSQVGSMDQVTLSNYWSPLNHHIHGRRGQTSPLQNCRASEQVGKYYCWKADTICHTSEFEVVHLSLYPKKSTKLLHIWWFQSAIHSHHISWRIEIICLIMSKLDLATMLHMWSSGLEGTVTPTKNLSAVGNGSFCTRTYSMCSYKEHKLQEECLLLNANSWQRGFILKPASIWHIFK